MQSLDNKIFDKVERCEEMFEKIIKLYLEAKEIEKSRWEQGDFFNIFNVVGLRTDEVRLHSALIAELLNPKGSHGSSSHFLQAFLEQLGIEEGYFDYARCSIDMVERVIGPVTETEGGRIDIIIEDGTHAIIIENKIYANDQLNQLLRYYNYGKRMFPNGFQLLYLTLDGHEPDRCTLGEKDYEYKIISYENEILRWLEKCSEIAENKKLSQAVIRQYSQLIKQITNKDDDMQYIKKLKAIMLAPQNIIAVGEILKLQREWEEDVYDKYIWKPLKQYADSKGLEFDKDCTYGESGAWVYKQDWKHYAIFIWTDKKNSWDDMYVGVSWYHEPNRSNKIFKKDYQQLNCLDCEPCDCWPYGYEYFPEDIRNWSFYIIEAIVQGKVFGHIKKKFDEILMEIEMCNLAMP